MAQGTTIFSLQAMDDPRARARATARSEVSGHRGLSLSAGVDLEAHLGADLARVALARLSLDATATAGFALEAAFPIDLYRQAGVVARVSAGAAAGVSLRATIDADLGELLEALRADHVADAYLPLLDVFVSELTVSAGLWARASLAAEAHGEVRLVGSLVPGPDGAPPGFTFLHSHSAGLGVGAGADLVVDLGFPDPARLLQRLTARVLVVVESRLAELAPTLTATEAAAARRALPLARFLVPLATRSAFELGAALRDDGGDPRGDATATLLRSFVREAQQLLGRGLMTIALRDLDAAYPGAAPALARVEAQLAVLGQPEAGSVDDGYRALLARVDALLPLADAAGFPAGRRDAWREGVALLWATTTLVRRAAPWSDGRAAAPLDAAAADPEGASPVAALLGQSLDRPLTLADLAALVASVDWAPSIRGSLPDGAGPVLSWLVSALAPAAPTAPIFRLLFVELADPSPERRREVAAALAPALAALVEQALVPDLLGKQALLDDAGAGDLLRRLALPLVRLLGAVLWPAALAEDGAAPSATVVREQISAVLLQLTSRFVLGTVDVLSRRAAVDGAAFMRALAERVRQGGGSEVVEQLLAADTDHLLGVAPDLEDFAVTLELVGTAIARHDELIHARLFELLGDLFELGLSTGDPLAVLQALADAPHAPGGGAHLGELVRALEAAEWTLVRELVPRATALFEARVKDRVATAAAGVRRALGGD
jgi:hypothetical protein